MTEAYSTSEAQLLKFRSCFKFDPTLAFHVGVERECFIANQHGEIVPLAPLVLPRLHAILEKALHAQGETGLRFLSMPGADRSNAFASIFGFELSACQIETRTRPVLLGALSDELRWQYEILQQTLAELDLSPLHAEVAPETMPLDVYPDPTGRYAKITADMPRDVLLAACRVAGTHIHVGMPDHETALHVYNHVVGACEALSRMGDNSSGERLKIYQVVAPDAAPKRFSSWTQFHELAFKEGFEEDPRKCWSLIRISSHGTIEFRMFGNTSSIEMIRHWAATCLRLCLQAAGR